MCYCQAEVEESARTKFTPASSFAIQTRVARRVMSKLYFVSAEWEQIMKFLEFMFKLFCCLWEYMVFVGAKGDSSVSIYLFRQNFTIYIIWSRDIFVFIWQKFHFFWTYSGTPWSYNFWVRLESQVRTSIAGFSGELQCFDAI